MIENSDIRTEANDDRSRFLFLFNVLGVLSVIRNSQSQRGGMPVLATYSSVQRGTFFPVRLGVSSLSRLQTCPPITGNTKPDGAVLTNTCILTALRGVSTHHGRYPAQRRGDFSAPILFLRGISTSETLFCPFFLYFSFFESTL